MRFTKIAQKLPAAGFGFGAIAWATSTELNYALAPKVCVIHWPLVPVAAAILALIALGGAGTSGIALWSDRHLPRKAVQGGVSHKMVASIGVLAGLLFAAIIVMQGLANFFLSGCE
jgi:hypothetical protein